MTDEGNKSLTRLRETENEMRQIFRTEVCAHVCGATLLHFLKNLWESGTFEKLWRSFRDSSFQALG